MPLLALLIALATASGQIHILNAPANSTIYVDGRHVATSRAAGRRVVINTVVPGKREVTIQTPGAKLGPFVVDVSEFQSATLTLSPANLAAATRNRSDTGDLRIDTVSHLPCSVTAAGVSHKVTRTLKTARHLPSGHHLVTVSCAGVEAKGEVEIRPRAVAVVAIDATRNSISLIRHEARATDLGGETRGFVGEIIRSDLPADWKRAIVSSIGSEIADGRVQRSGHVTVDARFVATTSRALSALMNKLSARPEVIDVTTSRFERIGGGYELRMTIEFAQSE